MPRKRNEIVERFTDRGIELIRIQITKGFTTVFDASREEEVLSAGSWGAGRVGRMWYAQATGRELRVSEGRDKPYKSNFYMHHLLMGRVWVKRDWLVVDHIDNNGLNNASWNLRIIKHRQNLMRQLPKTGKTARGIYWSRRDQIWAAQIKRRPTTYNLGYHRTLADAKRAYNEASLRLCGEWGWQNEIAPEDELDFGPPLSAISQTPASTS